MKMSTQAVDANKPEFTGWRAKFWPIHNYELKKFLPMGIILFCALFNYTIARDLKDALVVKQIEAEAISFIKFWCTTPLSIVFFLIYASLSQVLNKKTLFYASLLPFVIFFGLFGFVLYPFREAILPSPETIDTMLAAWPAGRQIILSYGKWINVLFYSFAEMWGSVVISLLFWQFANDITRIREAKRFYALFGLIGNMGLVASGFTLKYLSQYGEQIAASGGDKWEVTLKIIMSAFLACSVVIVYCYSWMQKNVLTDKRLYDPAEVKVKKKKEKPTLGESFKILLTSPYLALILLLVLGYGIAINLVEVTWKKKLGQMYVDENSYTEFMGMFSVFTGLATAFMVVVANNLVRKFGWLAAAAATPIMLLVTGGIFFTTIVFEGGFSDFMALFGLAAAPLVVAVFVGASQNIISKSTKYALFDPTKEMAYIPLSDELKVKGKAAVDVIGARLGKSGGSLIQQGLIFFFASGVANAQFVIAPYLFYIVIAVVVAWLFAVFALNVKFKAASKDHA